MGKNVAEGAEAQLQPITDLDLAVEAVFGLHHLAQRPEGHATPGSDVEHGQWIVCAEEQAFMHLGILAKMQQHPEPVGQ